MGHDMAVWTSKNYTSQFGRHEGRGQMKCGVVDEVAATCAAEGGERMGCSAGKCELYASEMKLVMRAAFLGC